MVLPASNVARNGGAGNPGNVEPGRLAPADLELLQRRYGLTRKTIEAAGLRSLSRQEVAKLVGFDPGSGGIGIPFPGWPSYWRVRLHEPWRDARGVPHRYLSPRGQPSHLYVPPILPPQQVGGTGLLVFTEGEFKALRAAQEGLPCVGLVGVWGWKARHSGAYDPVPAGMDMLIADFFELDLRRPVALVLDSDAPAGSPGYEAFIRLAHCLYRHGATEVRIVVLPSTAGLDKVGLDDFLNNGHGIDAVMGLIAAAPPVPRPPGPTGVPPFPVDALPDPVARWVHEVARAMGVPADYVGVPLLAAIATAIGRTHVLEVRPEFQVPAVLYVAVIGPPSSRKSPAFRRAIEPVTRQQAALQAQYDAERQRFREAKAQLAGQGRRHGSPKPELPPLPVLRSVYTSDATVERVCAMLHSYPRGLLYGPDELLGWLRSLNAYRNGYGPDRQFYLAVWNGADYKVDRKASDPEGFPLSLFLRRPFVCVAGTVVPDNLPLLAGPVADGLIDRFLLSWPPRPPWRRGEGAVSAETEQAFTAVFRALWALEDRPEPTLVHLAQDAYEAFAQWEDELAQRMEGPDFPDWLYGPFGKLAGQCARLALILHLTKRAAGLTLSEQVEVSTIQEAIKLAEYFGAHARRVHEFLREDGRLGRALDWLLSHRHQFPQGITARDLQRHRVAGVRNAREAQELLAALVARYGLQPAPTRSGRGCPAERYCLPAQTGGVCLDARRNSGDGQHEATNSVGGAVDTARRKSLTAGLLEGCGHV